MALFLFLIYRRGCHSLRARRRKLLLLLLLLLCFDWTVGHHVGHALAKMALFGLRGQLAFFGMMSRSSTVVASKTMTGEEMISMMQWYWTKEEWKNTLYKSVHNPTAVHLKWPLEGDTLLDLVPDSSLSLKYLSACSDINCSPSGRQLSGDWPDWSLCLKGCCIRETLTTSFLRHAFLSCQST